jgi:hypothetical protein
MILHGYNLNAKIEIESSLNLGYSLFLWGINFYNKNIYEIAINVNIKHKNTNIYKIMYIVVIVLLQLLFH